jgi:sigma-B regulation protein RsbU (phosphoserine phosphatase)
VLWGTGVSLGWLALTVIVVNAFRDWFAQHQQFVLFIINVAFLALLLAPISFAYAFNRWRLLDIEARLRRGTRYILITGASILSLVAIGLGVGMLAGGNIGRENQVVVTIGAIVLTALAFPAQKKLQALIERKIYPERDRLRQLIRDFLQRALSMPDKLEFWSQLEGRLQEGLLVESVFPIVRGPLAECYALKGFHPTPFCHDSDFLSRLERESRPLLVDEVLASAKVRVRADEALWLTDNKVALILPLCSQQKLVGFIGIGSKLENEDYSAEELRILDSLAPQIALASENIRLIEENVGKQRLEEQLRMARLIQQGFLPSELPLTPGLELAVCSKFSLEVAGDYHDVIDLDTGETVIAVGDVSGKGAGAALLMANLQASLRTAIGVGVPLSATVARINNLIFRNTPPEQYITFFVGVFDPRLRTFTYVNAGHNPPILLRPDGATELLETGGLILGCIDGAEYEEGTVSIEVADALILFTDGVSEAMDAREQEYGEERIRDYAKALRHLPSQEIAAELEQSVIAHHGVDQFDDDFTLVVVRGV